MAHHSGAGDSSAGTSPVLSASGTWDLQGVCPASSFCQSIPTGMHWLGCGRLRPSREADDGDIT